MSNKETAQKCDIDVQLDVRQKIEHKKENGSQNILKIIISSIGILLFLLSVTLLIIYNPFKSSPVFNYKNLFSIFVDEQGANHNFCTEYLRDHKHDETPLSIEDFCKRPTYEIPVFITCKDNKITRIYINSIKVNGNALSQFVHAASGSLEEIVVVEADLTELDLPKLPKLQHLDLHKNKLKRLELPHAPSLTYLNVEENHLKKATLQLQTLKLSFNDEYLFDLEEKYKAKFVMRL